MKRDGARGNKKYVAGFTLLEVLLSVALLALLAGIAIPLNESFNTKNALDVARNIAAQSLRRAGIRAQAVEGDTDWGVKVESGTITLFRGASFALRDPSFDELFDISGSVLASGDTEIVFPKFSGEPGVVRTLVLENSLGDMRIMTVNAKGFLHF